MKELRDLKDLTIHDVQSISDEEFQSKQENYWFGRPSGVGGSRGLAFKVEG